MLLKTTLPATPDLQQLIQGLTDYLFEALGMQARIEDWTGVKRLPLFLGKVFAFKKTQIGEKELLAVLDRTGQWTPDALVKQLQQIEKAADLPTIFATHTMTAQARARLVTQKASFVVPGQQLYLPFQGIIFKERFPIRKSVGEHMAYATQAALIHILLKQTKNVLQPGPLAKELQYTPMTMTRAFNELEDRGLAVGQISGRNRYLELKLQGIQLWDQAKNLMLNPVRKRLWVTNDTQIQRQIGYKAGLSALSECSELADPVCPIYAVPPAGWNWPGILASRKDVLSYGQRDAIEVECWAYPPALFGKGPTVDPLNLYLSMRDDPDQRIQTALKNLEADLW